MKGTKLIKVGVAAVCLAAVFQGTALAGWSLNVGIGHRHTNVQAVVVPQHHVDYVCYEHGGHHPWTQRCVPANRQVVRHGGWYVRPGCTTVVKVKEYKRPIFEIIRAPR